MVSYAVPSEGRTEQFPPHGGLLVVKQYSDSPSKSSDPCLICMTYVISGFRALAFTTRLLADLFDNVRASRSLTLVQFKLSVLLAFL